MSLTIPEFLERVEHADIKELTRLWAGREALTAREVAELPVMAFEVIDLLWCMATEAQRRPLLARLEEDRAARNAPRWSEEAPITAEERATYIERLVGVIEAADAAEVSCG
ncbi:MAG: hypothetical protein ABIT01_21115 [Thermoanaerobaculia bacterium]